MYKGIDDRGPYYRVSYYFTNWNDSDNVANQLRGYTQRVGGTTVRQPPHQHPLSPNLICMSCDIEGCGTPILNSQGYPYYLGGFKANCEYRTATWGPLPLNDPENVNQLDPSNPVLWCSQEIDFEDEVYILEKNQYIWESDSSPSKIPVKVTVGVTSMILTFPQLPYLPIATVRSLRNKVNSVAVLGVGIGKLWFKGARTVRELNTDGELCNKATLVFKERDVEWNKYLRPDGTWDYLKNGSSARVLAAGDLTPLLQI